MIIVTMGNSKNPQANAVCKRMHQTAGNIILQTLLHTNPPQDVRNKEHVIAYALQMAVYTLQTTVQRTAGVLAGAIVFIGIFLSSVLVSISFLVSHHYLSWLMVHFWSVLAA
jgi:hypothetical protein